MNILAVFLVLASPMFTVDRSATTWEEFQSECCISLARDRHELQWGLTGDTLEAAYLVNVVGRLWAYGNRTRPDMPGCVVSNEDTGFKPISLTFRAYMESRIGCCADHATALVNLCNISGWPAKYVLAEGGGHAWCEAVVDGQTWTLDATMMWMFSDQGGARKFVVFRHPGEHPGPLYRQAVRAMREGWMRRVWKAPASQ